MQEEQVWSLFGELRSWVLHSMRPKNKLKKKKKTWQFPGALELWAFTAMGLGQKNEYKIESANKTNQIYFKM